MPTIMDKVIGLGFFAVLILSLGATADLINRGRAKPGIIAMLLISPFLFLFALPMVLKSELPEWTGTLPSKVVIGVICQVIGGAILLSIRKK
jgi:hypothetical protein